MNKMSTFAAMQMDLDHIMLSEITQTEKVKYCMISLVCGILKMTQIMYIQNRNRLTDIEKYLWLPKRKGTNWGYGINRCKLLYIK